MELPKRQTLCGQLLPRKTTSRRVERRKIFAKAAKESEAVLKTKAVQPILTLLPRKIVAVYPGYLYGVPEYLSPVWLKMSGQDRCQGENGRLKCNELPDVTTF
eukprot:scaffold3437_cov113-Cylindrotheca_fusiformis.AAC.3